jgi:hypothetical protein
MQRFAHASIALFSLAFPYKHAVRSTHTENAARQNLPGKNIRARAAARIAQQTGARTNGKICGKNPRCEFP